MNICTKFRNTDLYPVFIVSLETYVQNRKSLYSIYSRFEIVCKKSKIIYSMTFISKIYLKIENKIARYENAVFICRVVKKKVGWWL